jgi:WD40-like Beta Propeller Repeat
MKPVHFVVTAVALVLVPTLLRLTFGAPRYSNWSAPANLGATVNSSFTETAPTLSKDGLSLYFSSNRPCGDGDAVLDLNIWVARHGSPEEPWDTPECLAINVDGFEDSAAAFSRDGHWMFFVSDRPGSIGEPGFNGRDIWLTYREHVHDDQAWTEPFHGGSEINSEFADAGPSYFENEEAGIPQLFFSSNRNGTFDLWVVEVLEPGTFGVPSRIDELSTDNLVEARPSIRHDGLELFFFRGEGVVQIFDIFSAIRSQTSAAWSEAINLGPPVSGPSNDQQPGIASDRETLFFASNRSPGGFGGLDIWMAIRSKAKRDRF